MLELNQLYLKECKKIEIINWNELQKPQLFINGDCMEYMKTMPDNYAELAICDPPYGIGMDGGNVGYQGNNNFEKKDWDKSTPKQEYFNELFRVSKNQIIWGGNYFPLPPTRCFVIWDKGEGFYNRTYAEAELAWTSFDKNVKIFKRDPLAMRDYNGKINPCQKPINLYEFLLSHYAKPGDKILDTHVGSASSLIACHNLHFDYIGFEIDPDYYAAATERLEAAKAQMKLF
ncbi:MAG TPA: DNA methyltransferase [Smithellaceae bacterium]|nr:DNA methyltransferase [Smithellaceae bacterium]